MYLVDFIILHSQMSSALENKKKFSLRKKKKKTKKIQLHVYLRNTTTRNSIQLHNLYILIKS